MLQAHNSLGFDSPCEAALLEGGHHQRDGRQDLPSTPTLYPLVARLCLRVTACARHRSLLKCSEFDSLAGSALLKGGQQTNNSHRPAKEMGNKALLLYPDTLELRRSRRPLATPIQGRGGLGGDPNKS